MARANLEISAEIVDCFQGANVHASPTRALFLSIRDERIVLEAGFDKKGGEREDFNALKDKLDEGKAYLILFCRDQEGNCSRQWILVCWIHDMCNVRDKMLYSSSREDVKRKLGAGNFINEYAASAGDVCFL